MWNLSQIPKKAHFYWGNLNLPFDRFLSIGSFAALNKDWDVVMHCPEILAEELQTSWDTPEHKKAEEVADNSSYWGHLRNLPNVEIISHSLADVEDLSEVHKSDFLRWGLLADIGGLWSDLDILYLRPMDDLYLNIDSPSVLDVDGFKVSVDPDVIREVICISSVAGSSFNSIGFMMSAPGSSLFGEVVKLRDSMVKESDRIVVGKEYQSLGRRIMDCLVSHHDFLIQQPSYTPSKALLFGADDDSSECFIRSDSAAGAVPLPGGINLPMDVVYPYGDFNVHTVLSPNRYENFLVTERTIGLHWYGGHPRVGALMRGLSEVSIKDMPDSIIKDLVSNVFEAHREYLFPASP